MSASDDLWPRADGWHDDPVEIDEPERSTIAPASAMIAAAAWVGAVLWFARSRLVTMDAFEIAQLVAALAIPPVLIGVAWLLIQRTSRAEARRFGASARAMRAEAAALEARVSGLSRTLATQREQLVQQLDAGTVAAGRLEAVGRVLADEIARADQHAHALADAGERARATVGDLLAALPHARWESEEVARRIDQAGLAAAAQIAALDAQLAALDARAQQANAHSATAADRLAIQIERMDVTGDAAAGRLAHVTERAAQALDELLTRTERATERTRTHLQDQGEATLAQLTAHADALQAAAQDNADAIADRIAAIDSAIDQVGQALVVQRQAGDSFIGDLSDSLINVERQMDALHTQGVERSQILAASISALGGSAGAMTEALRAGEAMATRTIGTTETLLIALDSAAREIDDTLPDALARLDLRIAQSRGIVTAAKPELLALVTAAESTHDAIEAIAGVLADQRRTADQLSATLLETLNTGRTKADALGQMVDETIGRTNRFAEESAPKLLDALLRVRDTAQVAADRARETMAAVIPEAAEALEEAAADAMRRATADTVARQVDALADASRAAVDAATRATERLAGHVRTIDEQTALVETRLEHAREQRDTADAAQLSRRVSLLIESLNSAAIDLTRALAPDVADSAWAAYLKGDRGVFTRRAVRLLDAGMARDIARLYDDDAGFGDHVNRYIHDFESMLRQVLAQRDGNPIAVTLLSSDMGKLYVALAQAIERLR
jgi:hypothetical protein